MAGWSGDLYRASGDTDSGALTAIPFYAWGNHDPGEMRIRLREA